MQLPPLPEHGFTSGDIAKARQRDLILPDLRERLEAEGSLDAVAAFYRLSDSERRRLVERETADGGA